MREIGIKSETEEILSVDMYCAARRLQKSEEYFHNRTLPCPAAPDKGDFLPSFESSREIFHCIPTTLRVGVAHVLENDIAFARLEYLAIVQSLHILETIEKIPESLNIRIVLRECLVLIKDGLEKLIHDGENETECHDIPGTRETPSDIVPDENNDDDSENFENITCSPKHPDDFPLNIMRRLEDGF